MGRQTEKDRAIDAIVKDIQQDWAELRAVWDAEDEARDAKHKQTFLARVAGDETFELIERTYEQEKTAI